MNIRRNCAAKAISRCISVCGMVDPENTVEVKSEGSANTACSASTFTIVQQHKVYAAFQAVWKKWAAYRGMRQPGAAIGLRGI